MNLVDYLIAAAGAWLILACVSGTGWALLAAHHKRRARRTVVRAQYPPPVAPTVNWLPLLPPVPLPLTPPLSQTLPDAAWFYDIPSDCLSDDAIHSLFDDIVRGEFA